VSAPQSGSSVAEYLGIPFAQPPLGQLRYADPIPLDKLPSGNIPSHNTIHWYFLWNLQESKQK